MSCEPNSGSGAVKASFPTLSVGKEAFTDGRFGRGSCPAAATGGGHSRGGRGAR
ncbi:hypothetical protein SAMN04489731_109198 [Amycolatopsis regifaucium]|nr:hypothetical protein SAMN04489731_109198 [Amycolatopsis regifaucium]